MSVAVLCPPPAPGEAVVVLDAPRYVDLRNATLEWQRAVLRLAGGADVRAELGRADDSTRALALSLGLVRPRAEGEL